MRVANHTKEKIGGRDGKMDSDPMGTLNSIRKQGG